LAVIGGELGYRLLRRISPRGEHGACDGDVYVGRSKMRVLFGSGIWDELRGKTVIDFGCGVGSEAVEAAQHGARKVIGIDNRESVLAEARRAAENASVADRCKFATETQEKADVVLSLDAFEHFDDPAGVLRVMRGVCSKTTDACSPFSARRGITLWAGTYSRSSLGRISSSRSVRLSAGARILRPTERHVSERSREG
jgi:SAM-dependent methyltransferase